MKTLRRRLSNVVFYLFHPRVLALRLKHGGRSNISMEELGELLPVAPVIIEAGAAGGEDTVRFAERWPEGRIYAFEPVPHAFSRLRALTSTCCNVFALNEALSVDNNVVELFVASRDGDPSATDSSSVLQPTEQLSEWPEIIFTQRHLAPAVTLASFFARERISHIDLLWLDMQGYELACIAASEAELRKVDRIYMEVSFRRFYKGAPLYPYVRRKMFMFGFIPELELIGARGGNVLFRRIR